LRNFRADLRQYVQDYDRLSGSACDRAGGVKNAKHCSLAEFFGVFRQNVGITTSMADDICKEQIMLHVEETDGCQAVPVEALGGMNRSRVGNVISTRALGGAQ